MSFFRYPGGKSKLKSRIAFKLNEVSCDNNLEYREPFFGGGSIGLLILQNRPNLKKVWINDFDLGISSLWTTLIKRPDLLKMYVGKFEPSVELFDNYKQELTATELPTLTSDEDVADFGFKKLAIHQISYSGLGTKSGGPLGGRDQKSEYKIDCRWSPHYICKKIDILNQLFSQYIIKNNVCTNYDFAEIINDTTNDALIYLDPPYYNKGNDLYQHGFTEDDHRRLADCLKKTKHEWVLSYDECPEIRKYYDWASIEEIAGVNYSITASKDKNTGERKSTSKVELLITARKTNLINSFLTTGNQYATKANYSATNCQRIF
jgi:DNA adenine methylase